MAASCSSVLKFDVEAVKLGLEGVLACAQDGHPGTELLERDELFLVGLDQPLDRGAGAGEVALDRVATVGGGVLGPRGTEAAADLRANELGLLEQSADLRPDERFDLISTDGVAVAAFAVGVAPAVLAEAAVVADPQAVSRLPLKPVNPRGQHRVLRQLPNNRLVQPLMAETSRPGACNTHA